MLNSASWEAFSLSGRGLGASDVCLLGKREGEELSLLSHALRICSPGLVHITGSLQFVRSMVSLSCLQLVVGKT